MTPPNQNPSRAEFLVALVAFVLVFSLIGACFGVTVSVLFAVLVG